MFDYLDKFNNLSPELKKTVSSEEAVNVIEKLEKKFNVDLASVVMRVMTKDINIDSLPLVLFTELRLNQENAEELFSELKKQVFYKASDYLGISQELNPNLEDELEPNVVEDEGPESSENIENEIKENMLPELEQTETRSPNKFQPETQPETISKPQSKSVVEIKTEDLSTETENEYEKNIKNIALNIFVNLNLKFGSEDKIKFLSIIEKHLRGVKDRFAVRQTLTNDKKNGGLALPEEIADDIFSLIKKINTENYQAKKSNIKLEDDILTKINKLSHGQSSVESDYKLLAPEDFSHQLEAPADILLSSPVDSLPDNSADTTDTDFALEPKNPPLPEGIFDLEEDNKLEKNNKEGVLPPVSPTEIDSGLASASKIEPLKPQIETPVIKTETEAKKSISTPSKPQGLINMTVGENGKIKMSDIKKVKVTNPVEELKYLDLTNFRRLDQDPTKAFEKIKQKLKVLENVDYGKMLEGIKAWRQSPVNRLYLKIFLRASNEGLSVDQIIEDLKRTNQDYLSRAEIDSLIKFNKSLVF